MEKRNVYVAEEVLNDNDEVARRQSTSSYTENEDGSWHWDCPESKMTVEQVAEWNRVMNLLSNVNGEDLRHVVCAVGLLDHCLNPDLINDYA